MAEVDNTAKKQLMTRTRYEKYQEELQDLKVNRRREIAAKIKEAREQGDLSENAEYDAAKDEQRDIEERIALVESIIKNAEIQEEAEEGVVNLGCRVKVMDLEDNEEDEFVFVSTSETDSINGRISNESPIGKALFHHKVGDIVKVETGSGEFQYKILDVQTEDN